MVGTFQALAVLLLALLPGALYVWSFEREAGGWGLGITDRLLRFIGASAVFHAVFAPLTYIGYRDFVTTGRLAHGTAPLWLWPITIAYVAVPTVAGFRVGSATVAGKPWTRYIVGRAPAPRAWDHLFSRHNLAGWIRLKLKTGDWIVGAYGRSGGSKRSYAAGYPDTQDLYLVETVECERETGKFVLDPDGKLKRREAGVLIRWEDVLYLEFIEVRRRSAEGEPQ